MYGVIAKTPEGLTAEQASKITAGIEVGFLQDVENWNLELQENIKLKAEREAAASAEKVDAAT